MLADGDAAPNFSVVTENGETISLEALKGRPAVIYFYPKDDTPGCTTEAKDFSCLAPDFEAAGIPVVGVSPDSPASHQKFKAKHGLALTLAADEDKSVSEAFGVWVQKSMYGKTYMGVERSTFLIDRAGRIARSWRKVKVAGHASAVLAEARKLASD